MVVFGHKFRRAIQWALIDQYDQLVNASLKFLVEHEHTYHRVALEVLTPKQAPHRIDIEACADFILDTKKVCGATVLGLKQGSGERWWENEVQFNFISAIPTMESWGTDEFWAYRYWQDELMYTCKEEFWQVDNVYDTLPFSGIDIFQPKTIKGRAKCDAVSRFYFSKPNWLTFVRGAVEHHFPDFPYSQQFSNKIIRRYLVEIKDGLWFGFEYDESDITDELSRGEPTLPAYLNLVLINTAFEKYDSQLNYYYKADPNIMSLGILGNPYFYTPTFPMMGFNAIDKQRQADAGRPYLAEFVETAPGVFRMDQPVRYADAMKRHAFFYLHLLAETSQSYLSYIRGAIDQVSG